MDKMYTCPVCKKPVLQSQGVRISKRYYHKRCQEQEVAKIQRKINDKKATKVEIERYTKLTKGNQAPEILVPVSEEEAAERELFYDKVKEIAGECTSKSRALAKRLLQDNEEFSWDGMKKTLVYCFEILKFEVAENKEIVGIIPWYYSEAHSFYEQLDNIQPEKRALNQMYKKKKIKVTPQKADDKLININEIGE